MDEAHTLHRKTAAHSHGAESSKRAILAGIDSIEHGTFLDDEAMRMMHDRGTFLVPTLTTRVGLAESKFPPLVQAKATRAVKQQDAMVKRALALGVKIALGTDAAVYPHGENALEFAFMVADGMTPAQSLLAGTTSAAELLGLQDKIGALKPGMLADVVAVPGNPIENIKVTQSVIFVMKDGAILRNDRAFPLNPRVPIPVGIAIAATCVIGFLYLLARWALYHPSKYPEGYWDTQQSVGASDAWMETSDGVKIHGWWVHREGSPLATLFLHGNAGNITDRAPRIQEIVAAGSSVLMLDYRGYGKSSGRPSEQGLYRDSEAGFIDLLGKGYRAEQIILHGESLGTAVAIDLASRRPCAALILEAPFTSASDVAGTVVPFVGPLLIRSFNSLPKIRWIRVPMLFMQGDRDERDSVAAGTGTVRRRT